MAITFSVPGAVNKALSKNTSLSHTCGADTKILFAILHTDNTTAMACKYGTQTMTQLATKAEGETKATVTVFYLSNPDTLSSKTVQANWSTASVSYLSVFDAYGADPTPVNAATASGISTTPSVTVTSADTSIVVSAVSVDGAPTPTYGAGQTRLYGKLGKFASYETGAASTVSSYTIGSNEWAIVGWSITTAAVPVPPDPYPTIPSVINKEIWMPKRHVVEHDDFTITDTIVGGIIVESLDCRLYLGNTDKTYACMLGSTQTYTENTYTTNRIKNLKGGNTYLLVARVTIDGIIKVRKCEIQVEKEYELR